MSGQLKALVKQAHALGASDLHLEPGLPPAVRIQGQLRPRGEPIPAEALAQIAREVVPPASWAAFLARRSFDTSLALAGVQCRVNVFGTHRGLALAVRLLASFEPTLTQLNLHPDLASLVRRPHGLVLLSGPTGSGKSSTLAALVDVVNRTEARHVITVEAPIEYAFRPRRAFIRQREVGRDTPSFQQALVDALREDPDVLVVGEMRDRETMQLTLDAAETGHLVLSTVHAATPAEALARVVSAFAPESQPAVRAQLAQSLVAVVAQRLTFRPEAGTRVPELEVLMATTAVSALIREGNLHKLAATMETGAREGMWVLDRYRRWLDGRRDWARPAGGAEDDAGLMPSLPVARPSLPPLEVVPAGAPPIAGAARATSEPGSDGVLEIEDAEETVDQIIARLETPR